ncbi:MAG TPA: hypothetical protein VNF73_01090 [Candidatus Saccharimonadales bacterium]|nr:hypothetical protein [Candidatus Saccharimonadales bacterium]
MDKRSDPRSDPTDPTDPKLPLDDEVAGLLREVANDWTMPPSRLDARGWHDRVRTDRAGPGRGRWTRHWLVQLGRAAGVAVAATVALGLLAVWLTLPHTPSAGVGASPLPATTTAPRASTPGPGAAEATPGTTQAAPSATPPTPGATAAPSSSMPAYARFGAPVSPSRLVVRGGEGYQVLDLATGTLTAPFLTFSQAYVALFARPNGQLVSLAPTAVQSTGSDGLVATVHLFNAIGTPTGSFDARTYVGRPDPAVKISGTNVVSASQGASAEVTGALSTDGSLLYLGWAVRKPPAWQTGIDVVDLASRTVVQTVHLPDVPSSKAGAAVYAWAPSVAVSPDGQHIVILGMTVDNAGNPSGSERWSAPVADGRIGALILFASGTGTLHDCYSSVGDEGFATDTTYYGVCFPAAASEPFLRRVDLGGRPLGDTTLTSMGAGPFPGAYGRIVDRATATYYAWNPFSGLLVRLDLTTGRVTGTATIPKPTASSDGPLGILGSLGEQVGRWLAPPAAAKMYLQPSLALSPDGTRLYVLGTTGTLPVDTIAGSSGVWVFDARTLALIGHWAPTADFVSVAVSPDGAYVYAAGMPGNDATGNQTGQDASVTVYQASNGQVRVIAGQLGQVYLNLAPAGP